MAGISCLKVWKLPYLSLLIYFSVYNAEQSLTNWDDLTKTGFFHLATLVVFYVGSSLLNVSLALHNFSPKYMIIRFSHKKFWMGKKTDAFVYSLLFFFSFQNLLFILFLFNSVFYFQYTKKENKTRYWVKSEVVCSEGS